MRELLPEGADAILDAASAGPGIIGAVRDGGRFVSVLAPLAPQPERAITVDVVSVAPDPKRLADLAAQAADGAPASPPACPSPRPPTRTGSSLPAPQAVAASSCSDPRLAAPR